MNTTQIILQFGGFGVIAVFFYIVLRFMLADLRQMRQENRDAFGAVIEQGAKFADTVNNHMDTNTRAIEQLCRMWDNGKK